MRISHAHKFIFFANPKTGSESLRSYLNRISDVRGIPYPNTTKEFPFYSHMRPIEAKAIFIERGWNFEQYYRFVCVRNPWARLFSLYLMIKKYDRTFNRSFSEWLVGSSTSDEGGGGPDFQRWRKFGTYSLRNFIGGDYSLVSDVFRLEDVDSIPHKLAERGMPVADLAAIRKRNVQKASKTYREHYDRDLIDIVHERYREEIELFHYEFE